MASCRSGAAAVEFAMVGLLVVGLILGISEFGRALYLLNQLAFAADIATRRVLIDPPETVGDLEDLEEAILDAVTFDRDAFRVELGLPAADGAMPITLSHPLTLLVPGVNQGSFVLRVQRRIQVP
nr:TadE/TadG family type IV pilus assembly protein [Paracoccus salsus]